MKDFDTVNAVKVVACEDLERLRTEDLPTGVKHDTGKPMAGCLLQFRKALMLIAQAATFGAKKYSRENWRHVPDAPTRYEDAMMRHLLAEGVDKETGLPHRVLAAWNLLALIELEHLANRKEQ